MSRRASFRFGFNVLICVTTVIGCVGVALAIWHFVQSRRPEVFLWKESGMKGVEVMAQLGNGHLCAFCGGDGNVRIWDANRRRVMARLPQFGRKANTLCVSPDGRFVAAGCSRNTILVWDVGASTVIATLVGHADAVSSIAFANDNDILVSAGRDRRVLLWRISRQEVIGTLQGASGAIGTLSAMRNGSLVVGGSWGNNGEFIVWDTDTRRMVCKWDSPQDWYGTHFFLGRSSQIAVTSGPNIQILHAANGTKQAELVSGDNTRLLALALSPDGKTLAAGSVSGRVYIWDLESRTLRHSFMAHSASVTGILFAPDGSVLFSGCAGINDRDAQTDGEIKGWRLK